MKILALAARRGDADVLAELPQLATLAAKDGTLSQPLAAPLTDLNEDWVKVAVKRAEGDIRCFAK